MRTNKSEKPILFNAPMVLGTLNGSKHQTRRLNGLKKINNNPDNYIFMGFKYNKNIKLAVFANKSDEGNPILIKSPYGDTGTELWVRESFSYLGTCDPGFLVFKATYPQCAEKYGFDNTPKTLKEVGERWTPSIHMPRITSRIQLMVESISIERAQDISEEDARDEGIYMQNVIVGSNCNGGFHCEETENRFFNGIADKDNGSESAYEAFQLLWENIGGKKSWDDNPYVWVIKFMVIKT